MNIVQVSEPRFLKVALLSRSQMEVFESLGRGSKTSSIAVRQGKSIRTVEAHIANIKVKLGLGSIREVACLAAQFVDWKAREKITMEQVPMTRWQFTKAKISF